MNVIEYKAINSSNKIIFGTIMEDELIYLETRLKQDGIRLISYHQKNTFILKRLTYDQQYMLWVSLSYYMMSMVRLMDALIHMTQTVSDQRLRNTLLHITQRFKQGEPFSHIMKNYLIKDDVLSLTLLTAAEKTGHYLSVLPDLKDYVKWKLDIHQKMVQMMRYPAIVFSMLWVAIFCCLYTLTPQLNIYFHERSYELPLLTRWLMALSYLIIQWPWIWFLIPFFIAALIYLIYPYIFKSRKGILYIPGLKQIILGHYHTNIANVVYLQLKHGRSLTESFETLSAGYGRTWVGMMLHDITEYMNKGISLSNALQRYDWFFQPFFIQLVAVGEQTNTLCQNLNVLFTYYEDQTRQKTHNLIKLLEPFLLVSMGGLLILIVGGLFYPMYAHMDKLIGGL